MYENNVNYSGYSTNDMYTVFLQDIVKKLSPYEWRAFEIIAASGVSEEKDAKEAVIQALIDNGEPCKSDDTAWRAVKALVKTGLYDAERIFTGYRNFNILKLTDIGRRLYRDRFRNEPPYQEHQILMGEHSSLLHGYMIKDVATILMKKGIYKSVSINRKKNQIRLWEGGVVIPDVIAVKQYGYSEYFEVECGNHHQADFNAKCNKLIALGNIVIIGQNRDLVTRILKPQVDRWIKAKGKNVIAMSDVKIYLYSLTDFAKGQVTYYYDMVSDEPVCCFKKKGKDE